ncbi:3-dehydrosphinganine reductase [Irineochytrium annulatum]|nr:3-dehydrosphinganine reductase [Irineochytrium annulatum]
MAVEYLIVLLVVAIPIVSLLAVIISFLVVSTYSLRSTEKAVAGKHVLVTGGSKGLGLSIALELTAAGARAVTIVARGRDRDQKTGKSSLDNAADAIRAHAKACGRKVEVHAVAADASNLESMVSALRAPVEASGYFDWCVLNAGSSIPGFLADQPAGADDVVRHMMDMNYISAANSVRALYALADADVAASVALPKVRNRAVRDYAVVGLSTKQQTRMPEKVILTGSVLSLMSFLGYSAYAGSKYALRGLADVIKILPDSLRSEFLPIGTAVHLYVPANMNTPGFAIEGLTKPAITAKIEGTAKMQTSQRAAQILIAGIVRGRFYITNDLLSELIRIVTNGVSPRPNPIFEVIHFVTPFRGGVLD